MVGNLSGAIVSSIEQIRSQYLGSIIHVGPISSKFCYNRKYRCGHFQLEAAQTTYTPLLSRDVALVSIRQISLCGILDVMLCSAETTLYLVFMRQFQQLRLSCHGNLEIMKSKSSIVIYGAAGPGKRNIWEALASL